MPVGACWCLLVPVGACWCLLVPVGACWCLLVPAGACWCLLVVCVCVVCVFVCVVGVFKIFGPLPGPAAGASHKTRELQTCTFEPRRFKTPPKFHEKTPREGRKNEISGGREKKKREISGPPKIQAPTPSGPTLPSHQKLKIGQMRSGQIR